MVGCQGTDVANPRKKKKRIRKELGSFRSIGLSSAMFPVPIGHEKEEVLLLVDEDELELEKIYLLFFGLFLILPRHHDVKLTSSIRIT